MFGILTKEKDFKSSRNCKITGEILKRNISIHKPDLVLLDLKMPEKNGLEIIKDLTEKEDKPKKNIIVISGEWIIGLV